MKRRYILLILPVFLTMLLASCGKEPTERQLYTMDTVCSILLYPQNEVAADDICDTLYALDNELSAYDGDISALNEKGKGVPGEDTKRLVLRSIELSQMTGGAFSPCLGTVIELWDIGGRNYIPTEDEIQRALASASIENIIVTGDMLELKNGVKINFGAIAKGYAGDVVKQKLDEHKVESAVISLGGNVYVKGKRSDGEAWNVGIRDPKGSENEWLGSVELSDKFVISSGSYERNFEDNGKVYSHIIDAETGMPCESDLSATVVICDDGSLGDALSTALFVMGRERAIEFWKNNGGFELILVGKDDKITLTAGIAPLFSPNDERGYVYETESR